MGGSREGQNTGFLEEAGALGTRLKEAVKGPIW